MLRFNFERPETDNESDTQQSIFENYYATSIFQWLALVLGCRSSGVQIQSQERQKKNFQKGDNRKNKIEK